MPELNDNLLKQVIFSMENQKSSGFLDLFNNTLVEVDNIKEDVQVASDINLGHFDKLIISSYPNRFLLVPTWGPFEGFKMREDFVIKLKNPVFKEKLNKVLHTGRGVFKKFKEVLHSNLAIERQWYSFKESYMKDVVVKWYEFNDGAIYLEKLPLDIEELPNDLLMEDFHFEFYEKGEKIEEINEIMNSSFEEISEIEAILIKSRQLKINRAKHLCILTPDDKVVGYLEYKKINDIFNEIISYGIVPEYRGLGLFSMMLDRFIRQSNREGYMTILLFFTSNFIKMHKLIENSEITCNLIYNSVDIKAWVEKNASTELLEV
jgi:RimJ/RimL family protein N-acetyltransferase